MEHFDVVMISVGLHGLAIARALVDASLNDLKRLVVLDEGRSIGGTWSAERLYPGLNTNNVVGSYELSDFPMEPERYGLEPAQHLPGLLFPPQTRVETAFLQSDGTWVLGCKCLCRDGPRIRTLTCNKLVIATHLTSKARMPTFPGSSDFLGPLFHAKDLYGRLQDLRSCREVVVIGGNKPTWDLYYSVATTGGARAHMIIRRLGGSPRWLTLARLASTRLCSWFDPSPFGSGFSSVRRLLHETILGAWLVSTRYSDPQLRMLRSWTSTFWMGNSLSIPNYGTDWFELVRGGRIVVHHAAVISLEQKVAELSGGSKLKADAVVCCTGWKCTPAILFKPEGLSEGIGLPREVPFPTPRDGIHEPQYENIKTPFQLYRFLVPPSPRLIELRNVAFIGMHRSVSAVMVAQAQALWIMAFFGGRLPMDLEPEIVYRETIWHTRYERMRRPRESGGSGGSFPDLVFDSITYTDLLLEDLGL
ncbi:FAD/NAD(P)-binding domain-containing protein [Xylaria grammica]|nr:FAD/NAD(P)-binding domain-containing protein [Xylaria grammica]